MVEFFLLAEFIKRWQFISVSLQFKMSRRRISAMMLLSLLLLEKPLRTLKGEFADNRNTVLVNDNYYSTEAARAHFNVNGINFISSIQSGRFSTLISNLRIHGGECDKPGMTSAIIKRATGEILVHHWDADPNVGHKYCLANCFQTCPTTRSREGVIPGYSYYKVMFSLCDAFNRALHDRLWPHRCGGGKSNGHMGHIHKFAMGCVIQNTINAYCDINKIPYTSFKDLAIQLSDELFDYAMEQPN
jgi:hypothetical protein